MKPALSLWAPVAVYVLFIFWLSSAPRPVPPMMRWPGADKVFHTVEYAPLGGLLLRAITQSMPLVGTPAQGLASLAALAVGVLDEWYQ